MSILIITTPRTGSTVLTTALARTFKYRPVYEPFNPIWKRGKKLKILPIEKDYSDIDFDNIDHNSKLVVKCMTHQHPDNSNTFDYFREFAKKFKHVIILDRRNVEDQATSYAIAAERTEKEHLNRFGSPYSSDYPIDPVFVHHKINFYLNEKPKLELLELDLGIYRVWYDDLYSHKTLRRENTIKRALNGLEFDTSLYLSYTNPQRRLKQDSQNRNLI